MMHKQPQEENLSDFEITTVKTKNESLVQVVDEEEEIELHIWEKCSLKMHFYFFYFLIQDDLIKINLQ